MVKSIIRTDQWNLNPSSEVKNYLQATVSDYRAFCQALSYVSNLIKFDTDFSLANIGN